MNKLKLHLDALRVETFQTAAEGAAGAGTVLGHVRVPPAETGSNPCVPYTQTCGASCNGTCNATCQGSCYGSCAPDYTCYNSCNPLARCIPPAV